MAIRGVCHTTKYEIIKYDYYLLYLKKKKINYFFCYCVGKVPEESKGKSLRDGGILSNLI